MTPSIYKLFFLRFFSNSLANGFGFQLEYESINVSQWTFRISECGGIFTTPKGILTSPSYPSKYPDNANCVYTISQPNDRVILLNILSMDMVCHSWDAYYPYSYSYSDYLEIRDGPSNNSPILDKLCDSEIPASIQSRHNQLWMKWGEASIAT